jgi:ATPase subunit of ABC transporter with duplicated ATPase domains
MLFGKLMLQQPNVLIMDEPTNHMDMESISG